MTTLTVFPAILLPTAIVANGSAALLFTAGGTNGVIVKKASFANITASSFVSLQVWRLPNGISSVASQYLMTNLVVVPPQPAAPYIGVEFTNLVLYNGDSLWALAGAANGITATFSGFNF